MRCLVQILCSLRLMGEDVGTLENRAGHGGHRALGPELWLHPGASVSTQLTLKFMASCSYPNHSIQTVLVRSHFPVQNRNVGASVCVLFIVWSLGLHSSLTASSFLEISFTT